MAYLVVHLISKRFIVIKKEWAEVADVGKPSKIFYSKDRNAVADSSLQVKHYLNAGVDACYEAFIYKTFSKYFKQF